MSINLKKVLILRAILLRNYKEHYKDIFPIRFPVIYIFLMLILSFHIYLYMPPIKNRWLWYTLCDKREHFKKRITAEKGHYTYRLAMRPSFSYDRKRSRN